MDLGCLPGTPGVVTVPKPLRGDPMRIRCRRVEGRRGGGASCAGPSFGSLCRCARLAAAGSTAAAWCLRRGRRGARGCHPGLDDGPAGGGGAPQRLQPPCTGAWPEPTPAHARAATSEPCSVPVVNVQDVQELDRQGPVVVRGISRSGAVAGLDRAGFLQEFGHLVFRLRPCASLHEYGYPGPCEDLVTLQEYFDGSTTLTQGLLFENDFHAAHGALRKAYEVPVPFETIHGRPIFSAGRRGTGVGFHRHSENWLAQLYGRKAWFLAPADTDRPPTRAPWLYIQDRPPGVLYCVVEPGEALYVPDMWWHATWNLDEFNVALGWEGGDSQGWSDVMHAIADGDRGRVERALRVACSGSPFAEADAAEMIPLAARSGDAELLRWLLDEGGAGRAACLQAKVAVAGGCVAAASTGGGTGVRRGALEAAPGHTSGAPDVAADSPDAGVEVAAAAAVAAARAGHEDVLQLLLGRGYTGVLGQDGSGGTALHEAACCGRAGVARLLLRSGADAGAPDAQGRLPLHLACLHGQASVVRELLASAADLHAAHAAGSTPLAQAAFNGHVSVVRQLLGARASVGAADALRMTPLHQAASRGNAAVVSLLVSARADVASRDFRQRCPLHLAALGYDNGDPSAVPDFGFESAKDSNLAAVQALLAAGADPSALDASGATPAVLAHERGHADVCTLLRDSEAGGVVVVDALPEAQ